MQEYEQTRSGIYIPQNQEMDQQAVGMVESPMMQYLMLNIFNSWAFDEENWKTVWNSPIYTQLALISDLTMRGITLIQEADDVSQSKRWAVTSMMARGVSLARLSCLSLALGSFSDAFSNYRMLLEREMTLKYLEANDQYEAFAKAFYSEAYHRASKGLNDGDLRKNYSQNDLEESKKTMALIRAKYFGNEPPKAPGAYWTRPKTEELADKSVRKEELRAYDLGSRSVHPQLRDMVQPEEADIAPEALMDLIVTTLGGVSIFVFISVCRVIPTCGQDREKSYYSHHPIPRYQICFKLPVLPTKHHRKEQV